MSIVLIRTFILYFIVLFAIRIMGKSELSKMSPFQMVVIFMIAELAAIPIESPTVSFISGVIAIFTLLFLQVLYFNQKREVQKLHKRQAECNHRKRSDKSGGDAQTSNFH